MEWLPYLISFVVGGALGYFLGKKNSGGIESSEKAYELNRRSTEAKRERVAIRKERILEMVKKSGRVTNDDVESRMCISDSTAGRYLDELEKEGKLVQHGGGRGTYYVLSKE